MFCFWYSNEATVHWTASQCPSVSWAYKIFTHSVSRIQNSVNDSPVSPYTKMQQEVVELCIKSSSFMLWRLFVLSLLLLFCYWILNYALRAQQNQMKMRKSRKDRKKRIQKRINKVLNFDVIENVFYANCRSKYSITI